MELTIEQALRQGVAAHKEGRLQNAERLYRIILQSQPTHPDANHNLGVLAVSINKAGVALPLFKTALKANPKIEQFWLSYIDALIKEKKFDNAKQILEKAKTQGIDGERLSSLEAQLLPKTQKPNTARANPPQELLNSLLGQYQNERFSDAEKLALQITQDFPKHQFAWKVLGAALKQTGRAIDSLTAMQKSVQLVPQDAEAHNNLGLTLQELGRLDEAVASYNRAIVLKPNFAEVHYNLGNVLQELGRLDEAETSYNQAIVLKPNYTSGYNNLGNTQKELGKLDEAEASFTQALTLKPDFAEAYNNLGNTLKEMDRLDEAEASYTQAIKLKPHYAEAHYNLGIILKELGRLNEAKASYKQAISFKPAYFEAHNNLGVALRESNRLNEAKASYIQAIKLKPNYVEAHNNLGVLLKEQGKYNEAEVSYNQAIILKPDYAEAYSNLGNALKELDRLDEAEASYGRAIILKPDYGEAHYNLAVTLQEIGRYGEAEQHYTQAIALKPDYAEVHNNLGVMLKNLGRLDEAEQHYTQAIILKPDYAEVHRHLTSLKKFESQDEQYAKMQELYFNRKTSNDQRCHINFSLAKACEDLGNFKQAYEHYREGNMLRKKLLNYDINHDIELFNQIQSKYTSQIIQKSFELDRLSKHLTPIFIVGMPRSGTTLVEQIISSHSQITGAGELPFITQFGIAITKDSSEVTETTLLNFRTEYLTKLQNLAQDNLIVTDKMPQNFLCLGLIAATLPEAKIVHVKRNPAAVCWANYKQYFESKSVGYCYALDDILTYHKLYENLMELWAKSIGKRIYNLDYELLTINQESETRHLIDYLGVEWDESCLSPQNNTRSVATASNLQVRKKVYQGSSEQWKKYEPFLNGALDGLLSS